MLIEFQSKSAPQGGQWTERLSAASTSDGEEEGDEEEEEEGEEQLEERTFLRPKTPTLAHSTNSLGHRPNDEVLLSHCPLSTPLSLSVQSVHHPSGDVDKFGTDIAHAPDGPTCTPPLT